MDNDNSQPLLLVGKLPKEVYTNLQEFVEDLGKIMRIPIDTISVIKGARGEKGDRGESVKGPKGDRGPAGAGVNRISKHFEIPSANSFVEFDSFPGWDQASYVVGYNGQVDSTDPDINNFGDTAPGALIGVLTVVELFNEGSAPITIRAYLTGSVPDSNYVLKVTTFQ